MRGMALLKFLFTIDITPLVELNLAFVRRRKWAQLIPSEGRKLEGEKT